MVNEHVVGKIVDISEDGTATITAVLPNLNHAIDRKYEDVEIILQDGRRISPEQRRKCYALLGEIAEFVNGWRDSDTIEEAKNDMKWDFILKQMESQERKMFSLADCDMSLAREFITYLIDFIIKNDIPTKISLIDQAEDISRYMYACTLNRKCAVCGQHADIHHLTGFKIAMGGNRDKVHHLGREVLPLCREHHNKAHEREAEFMAAYHLQPVVLDENLCKKLKLRK